MQSSYLIAIVGQTATGKSAFAVTLAKQLKKHGISAEIISADSRQVYTGLDIGTGKITKKEMGGIPHHMIDVVSPTRTYTVARFKKNTDIVIKKLHKQHILPILVGGTGFYIDSILYEQTFPEVQPNPLLRKYLEKKSITELLAELKKLDTERYETIDKANGVRIIRAIEIATALGAVPKSVQPTPRYDSRTYGITLPDMVLKEKISTRLVSRIKRGMIKEATKLHEQGLSWKRMSELGLEYRALADYLTKKITKEDLITRLNKEIWQYAKRQKTWFKRNKDIRWINPDDQYALENTVREITAFLQDMQ
ncbi:tRNA (adenosine(37)-N6)-dimethylallyltransferase MiaA [Candidatus Nomurabacteria bacterium]|nr:tRNA (adenosine(37)-N6)-dimethylallyltransferase MiaA [Candidatus Nomurabacteria bacterium]